MKTLGLHYVHNGSASFIMQKSLPLLKIPVAAAGRGLAASCPRGGGRAWAPPFSLPPQGGWAKGWGWGMRFSSRDLVPQFPHLQNGDAKGTRVQGAVTGTREPAGRARPGPASRQGALIAPQSCCSTGACTGETVSPSCSRNLPWLPQAREIKPSMLSRAGAPSSLHLR